MKLKKLFAASVILLTGWSTQAQTVYTDQGENWRGSLRDSFYTQDQGSRIMPISWLRALQSDDGKPFLHDRLARYGYLPMPGRKDADLPIGFTTNGAGANQAVGMSCAACHVRQIEVNGTAYRIDGGPAVVDFQSFVSDLDLAAQTVLASDEAFAAFAAQVLGRGAEQSRKATLRKDFGRWAKRFHVLISSSMPDDSPWGPIRLDAFAMIFNKLGGMDIGPAANDGIIADNLVTGTAPARYPFLWNASKQDFTQWPGFLTNGNDFFGLVRNLGEAYGVFADFRPHPKNGVFFNRDYLTQNSANFSGLQDLERWLKDLGPPAWPWDLDHDLVAKGETVFNLPTSEGGCAECHAQRKGAFRSPFHKTLKTTVVAVNTDASQCEAMARKLKTGVLEGASIPLIQEPLGAEAPAIGVLGTVVAGAILQNSLSLVEDDLAADMENALHFGQDDKTGFVARHKDVIEAFNTPRTKEMTQSGTCKYEGRVLEGIWAAAPYLHNGSVPTLAELLKKPEDRVASFKPGPNYDIGNVGLAIEQTKFDYVLKTTGCEDVHSGNSRCGHDFGTDLNEQQKRALIEYLKSL